MGNFPNFNFKIDCGNDPAVRQWLHDNGVTWVNGKNAFDPLFHEMLCVEDRKLFWVSTREFFDKYECPLINPYEYMQPEKKITIKPFYIRHTPDMTDAQVAEVFDKAVRAGAIYGYGVKGFHSNEQCTLGACIPQWFKYFGITKDNETWVSDVVELFGEEITLNQVDEWLGIAPKPPTVAERMAALIEEYREKIPEWARWIAITESGSLECGTDMPYGHDTFWSWRYGLSVGLGHVEGFNDCWRETLTELNPDAISQYYNDRRGIKTEKPDESCWDQEMMILRDKGTRSKVENEYLSRTAFEHFAKELSVKPLTIPSTLPSEQAMPMMLGGEFGGKIEL